MNKIQKGFTLAEVLITLGIIGVVAAMTLPDLITNHREKQRVAQLKKVYSVLSQAYQMAKLEYGEPENWGITTTHIGIDEDGNDILDPNGQILVSKIFLKYIKQVKSPEKYLIRNYLSLDGRKYSSASQYLESKNSLYLADGTIVTFGWMIENCADQEVSCGDIAVFLPERTAQLGVSTFYFYFTPNAIMPYGHQSHVRSFEQACDRKNKSGLSSQSQGRGCTAWVIYNGNMDYLHCDDLSWNGKSKCK